MIFIGQVVWSLSDLAEILRTWWWESENDWMAAPVTECVIHFVV
jgi:hypothetical protein